MKGGRLVLWAASAVAAAVMGEAMIAVHAQTPSAELDPAAWGANHVGKPMPAFEEGNLCLFCHRATVGADWDENAHRLTIRTAAEAGIDAAPDGTDFVLGDGEHFRFLRRGAAYGTFDIHDGDAWDGETFGRSCLGCHSSGVDSAAHTFTTPSVDCFACHGAVDLGHTDAPETAFLSPRAATDARAVTSVCASCHIRTGTSRSTGLPYPNAFVAGDNVFIDLAVDLSEETIAAMEAGERHIYENIRAVAIDGDDGTTCLSCHDVHRQSTAKHKTLERGASCYVCHHDVGPLNEIKPYERRSALCGYGKE